MLTFIVCCPVFITQSNPVELLRCNRIRWHVTLNIRFIHEVTSSLMAPVAGTKPGHICLRPLVASIFMMVTVILVLRTTTTYNIE